MVHQVRPVSIKRGSDEKLPGLVRFDHQFLLLTHFTRQTRNWGTGVEYIKAPGRPCYWFHPGTDRSSYVVRAEHGVKQEPTRDECDQENIPTRNIRRADTHPQESGNTISQNRGSCASPRAVEGHARSTFAHNLAVRVP